jgi:hypothetical protein
VRGWRLHFFSTEVNLPTGAFLGFIIWLSSWSLHQGRHDHHQGNPYFAHYLLLLCLLVKPAPRKTAFARNDPHLGFLH